MRTVTIPHALAVDLTRTLRHDVDMQRRMAARARLRELLDGPSVNLEPPKRRLEIEGSPSDGYDAWFTDSDGNLNTVVSFADPRAAADWCERNGFAWEVIGLEGDPAQWLADWRAQQ